MRLDSLKSFALSLPAATVIKQWGENLVFKVGGKMFAVTGPPKMRPQTLSFKAGDSSFDILTRAKNIIPAPYLARAKWVNLQKLDALITRELKAYLMQAHALVAAGLTKKKRAELGLA